MKSLPNISTSPVEEHTNHYTSQEKSVHLANQPVDQLVPVAMVTTLDKMPSLLPQTPTGVAQFERPQEIVGLFKVGAHRKNLVNQIFHTDDPVFPQLFLNNGVFRERYSLMLNFAVASLVDELPSAFEIGIAVGVREREGGSEGGRERDLGAT